MDPALINASDEMLVAATRRGRHDAFAELYRRHLPAATRYARRLCTSADSAHDVTAEAFIRLFQRFRDGRGPSGSFAAYVMRTVRNIAYDLHRRERRLEPAECLDALPDPALGEDPVLARFERRTAARAFETLPARWRLALQLTTVDGVGVHGAAERLGLSPGALTSLAYRAREGLRQAYLQAHLAETGESCRDPRRSKLAAHLRGGLGAGAASAMRSHLESCPPCRADLEELAELNARLPGSGVRTTTPAPDAPPRCTVPAATLPRGARSAHARAFGRVAHDLPVRGDRGRTRSRDVLRGRIPVP